MKKWQFNKKVLQDAIDCGNHFLLTNKLSNQQRRSIRSDIVRFQNFLSGDFEDYQRKVFFNPSTLKRNILNGMKRHHRIFKGDLMSWFIELNQAKIFKYHRRMKVFKLPIEEMAEQTLKVYRTNAPLFYNCAKEFIYCSELNLIQEAEISSSSYCFYSDILKLPFIVINKNDDSYVLNHEIQHAIEYMLDIAIPEFYHEFGPIYFESLFIDSAYEKHGKKVLSGFVRRIQDMEDYLDILSVYLYSMSVFSHYDFDVSDEFFYEIWQEATGLSFDYLTQFLNHEIVNREITSSLSYLLSFLKAIEIRDVIITGNPDGRRKFNDLLFTKKFSFTPPSDGFEPYARFVNEVKQKVR